MRFFITLLLFSIPLLALPKGATSNEETTFKIIGDSVYLENGSTCHIDNFNDGICEASEWDFSFFNFWIGLLIPFVFFGYIAITVKKKINQRKTK